MTIQVLHLDDDIQTLERFKKILGRINSTDGVNLTQFDSSDSLIHELNRIEKVDLIILDVSLAPGDRSGVEIAGICRKKFPKSSILMCSASRDLSLVRDCLVNGADDFITKDWEAEDILKRIEFVTNLRKTPSLQAEKNRNIAGNTMRALEQRVPLIIESAINCVYLEGESGTGKEVVAELFEHYSPKSKPFIKVNCATIPQSLIQSELFGHIKGSFTGANSDKKGLLESADGGWIFLDEISTLSFEAQAGLLRAIENQAIRRIGSNHEMKISIRFISATNEPLSKLVDQQKFRKDLWQRLCETQIILPPLRSRKDEITEIAQYFCSTMRGGPYTLAPLVMEALVSYDWPQGNIRELRNCLRAMTEKASSGILTPSAVPDSIWQEIGLKKKSESNLEPERKSLAVRWSEEVRPNFEFLSSALLLEIIRDEYRKIGPMSMRAAAKATGIPKSTMAVKLEQIISLNLISKKELQLMIKSFDTSDSTEP